MHFFFKACVCVLTPPPSDQAAVENIWTPTHTRTQTQLFDESE